MSVDPDRYYSLKEYLAFDATGEFKCEFYRGRIYPMCVAGPLHSRIRFNLLDQLGSVLHITKKNCWGHTLDRRIRCGSGFYTYPDAAVTCGKPQYDDARTTVLNPTVIFEVLTSSSEGFDRGKKFEHYRSIASFKEYILIAQDRVAVDHFVVEQHSGRWECDFKSDLSDVITLQTCGGYRVELSKIYSGVDFPPPTIADIHPSSDLLVSPLVHLPVDRF